LLTKKEGLLPNGFLNESRGELEPARTKDEEGLAEISRGKGHVMVLWNSRCVALHVLTIVPLRHQECLCDAIKVTLCTSSEMTMMKMMTLSFSSHVDGTK